MATINSSGLFIALPPNSIITSPALIPAFCAGPPATTPVSDAVIFAPDPAKFISINTPITGYVALPVFINWSAVFLA